MYVVFLAKSDFVDFFLIFCCMFVFIILSCLFLAALWSPAGKGLTVCDVSLCFCHFPHQMLYLIVSIPYLCILIYF